MHGIWGGGRNPGKRDKEGKSESGEKMMEREVLGRGLVICHSQWRRRKGNFREGDVSPEDFYRFSIQTETSQSQRMSEKKKSWGSSAGTWKSCVSFQEKSGDSRFPQANSRGGKTHLCVKDWGRTCFLSGSENTEEPCFRIDYSHAPNFLLVWTRRARVQTVAQHAAS